MKKFEDYLLGDAFESESYPVTRDEVIDFASKFDPQPMHLDDRAAEANPVFKKLSASGMHTMAITSRMFVDQAKSSGHAPLAGLGLSDMRLLEPVYPGDVLSLRTTVVNLRPSTSRPACGIVNLLLEALNQHGRVVLRYVSALLVERQTGEALN